MANVLTRVERYHAEPVAAGGFQNPPVFHLLHSDCPQPLEAPDFGFKIVGLDVQMHPARVIYGLQLDVRPSFPRVEDNVVRIIRVIGRANLVPQSLAPEEGLPIKVFCFAIDDQAAKAAAMHMPFLQSVGQD